MNERRLDRNGKLYIACSAIWFDDKLEYEHQPFNIKSGFVICGHRHHNCFMTAHIINENKKIIGLQKVQGFITSGNEFVDRVEGAAIAFYSGQTKELCKKLFSEDIY